MLEQLKIGAVEFKFECLFTNISSALHYFMNVPRMEDFYDQLDFGRCRDNDNVMFLK